MMKLRAVAVLFVLTLALGVSTKADSVSALVIVNSGSADTFTVIENGNTFNGGIVEGCRSSILNNTLRPCSGFFSGVGTAIINGVFLDGVGYSSDNGPMSFVGAPISWSSSILSATFTEPVAFFGDEFVCAPLHGACPDPGPNPGVAGAFSFDGEMGLWTISIGQDGNGGYNIESESYTLNFPIATPEPGMLLLTAIGIGALAFRYKRRVRSS
jgi:hypothetical protein